MNQNAPWDSLESNNPAPSGQIHMFDPSQFQAACAARLNEPAAQHMNTNAAALSSNMSMMPGEQWKNEQQPMYDHSQARPHIDQGGWNVPQQQGYYPVSGGEQDNWASQTLQPTDSVPMQGMQDQLHNGYCYRNEMHDRPVNDTSNPHDYQTPLNGNVLPPGVSSEPPSGSMHDGGDEGGMTAFFGGADDGTVVYPANSAAAGMVPVAQMDNVPLDDSAASSDGRVGSELPKLFSTGSFSNLPLEPTSFNNIQTAAASSFDGIGSNHPTEFDNLPTQQSGGETADGHPHAHFLGTTDHTNTTQGHHSRQSSYGDRVNFLVGGSASTSGNPSATQSPYIFGHSGEDAAGGHIDAMEPAHHHDNTTDSPTSTHHHSNPSHPGVSSSHDEDAVESHGMEPPQQLSQPPQQLPQPPQQLPQPPQQLSQPPQQLLQPAQQLSQPTQQLSQPPQQLLQPAQQLSQPPQQPQQLSQQPQELSQQLQQVSQAPQQQLHMQWPYLPQQPQQQLPLQQAQPFSQPNHQQHMQLPQSPQQQLTGLTQQLQQQSQLPQQQQQPQWPQPEHEQHQSQQQQQVPQQQSHPLPPAQPPPQQPPSTQQGHRGPGQLTDTWQSNTSSSEPHSPTPNMSMGPNGMSQRQQQIIPASPLSQQSNSSTGSSRFEHSFNQLMSSASQHISGSSSIAGSDELTNQEVPRGHIQQVMTPEDAQPAQVSSPRSAGPLTTHTNSPFQALPRRHVSGSSTASSTRGGEENQQVLQLTELPLQVVPDVNENMCSGMLSRKAVPSSPAQGVGEQDYDELSTYQKARRSQESRSRCITPATATLWADNSLSAPPVAIVLAPAAPLDVSGASQPLSPPASCQSGSGSVPMSAASSGGRPLVNTVPIVINPPAGVLPAGQFPPVTARSASLVQPQPVRPNVHGPHSAFHLPTVVPPSEPGVSRDGGSELYGRSSSAKPLGDAMVLQQQATSVTASTLETVSHVTTSVPTLQTQASEPQHQELPPFQPPQQQQLPQEVQQWSQQQQQQQQPVLEGSRSSSRQGDSRHYPTSSTPGSDPRPTNRDSAHHEAYPNNRPSSRQQRYPDDRPDERPRSQQQQYPDDRHRQRHEGYRDDRPSSRQGQYGDSYRPSSRQGEPWEEGSRSRQGAEERSSRSSSRQGYPDDRHRERSRGRSRPGQHGDERDRSRSRQRYYPDDRPHSRQDQYYQDDRSRSRGYYDDRRGYEDGRYYGTERQYSQTGTKDTDRSRQHYYYKDPHYKDYYYDRYYYDYYREKQGTGYYDQDPYVDRYSRGYYEELQAGGQQQQDPRYQGNYDYSQAAHQYYDQRSQHSHSRGSTPADAYYEQGSQHGHSRSTTPALGYPSDAPNVDRQSGYGSRPCSRQGDEFIASPIYPGPEGNAALSYYDQSYSYAAAPQPEPVVEPKRYTPHKFTLPHIRASFGASGQLVKVLPNQPSDGQPALVVIQDLVDMVGDERVLDELTIFPGPLIKGETHKNDVLMYCQKKARQCRDDGSMVDRESAELLWKYLQLLIKQNGTVVGADIADLLLEGHEPSSLDYSRHGMRISRSREDLLDDSSAVATTTGINRSVIGGSSDLSVDDVTDRFRNLLLHGQKKDALEWAIKHSLWGHALFLASKMDQKTHASVMTRFANVSMKMNDPLQTLYQLMSGRQPAAVTLAMDEKWGDWRPHLAMILSNQSNKPDLDRKSIIILGDTLAAKGCLHASHFCYLMASVALTDCTHRSSKLVLIGSSHSLPFGEFASNMAIQCTEVYEYAQSLGNPLFVAISFQTFKMIYMLRLLEAGLLEQALHYCEVIARTLLQNPQFYTSTLVALLYQFADRLKLYDPLRLQMGDDAVEDPDWLVNLHRLHQAFQDGSMQTISGTQTPVIGMRNGSTATNSEVGDILLYGQQHVAFAPNVGAQIYATASQSGAAVHQDSSKTDIVTGQQLPDYQQQHAQPGLDPNQLTQQQWDPNLQTQQQQWDPNQQQTQQQQWDPNQQTHQQQWDPNQQQTQQQQWDPNQQQTQQQQWDPSQQQTQQQQWDPSQQTQQWSQGQLDNGYPGYQPESGTGDVTDGSTGLRPPPMAAPGDNAGQQGAYQGEGQVPQEGQKGVDLMASMNSAVTTTTTDEDDESQDGGAPPGYDYYGMNAQPSAGSSLPLGASASNFDQTVATPGKQTYPGEEEDDKMGTGRRRQTYPGEENDGNRDFYSNKANKSWFGSFMSKFARKSGNEIKLPDDKNPTIVWDAERKRWVNTDQTEEELDKPAAPPPKDSELSGGSPDGLANSTPPGARPPAVGGGPIPGVAPPPGANKFSLQRSRGARKQYVDVLAGNASKPCVAAPTHLFNTLPKSASMPANMFVPSVTAESLNKDGEGQDSSDVPTLVNQQTAAPQPITTNDPNETYGELGIKADQAGHQGAPLEPVEAQANPTVETSQPPPSSVPMMFNPAQFSHGAEQHAAPTSSGPPVHGPRYGQRRLYPK